MTPIKFEDIRVGDFICAKKFESERKRAIEGDIWFKTYLKVIKIRGNSLHTEKFIDEYIDGKFLWDKSQLSIALEEVTPRWFFFKLTEKEFEKMNLRMVAEEL